MQPNDKPQFLAVLNGLAAVKPGAKLTNEGLDVWWASFADWAIEDFRNAAAKLAKRHEFMPNPFHFEELRKASRPTAGEAFAVAREIAKQARPHSSSSSGDPRIDAAAAACGGYFAMGQHETEKIGWLEKRFAEHYESISEAEDTREAVPQIAGQPRARISGPQPLAKLLAVAK